MFYIFCAQNYLMTLKTKILAKFKNQKNKPKLFYLTIIVFLDTAHLHAN
ncbi:hypothetical protein HMPREF0789_0035 [Staphylococcus epidermidis BCM-HMP0060]|nr:hypothetical protein HMPREF0789_0035 [Staphylococcus epidermidis BCM-HMP0060]